LIMNRIWPREVIAEIRLMPWRAPVVSTLPIRFTHTPTSASVFS
jgi:hypothetical protein